MNLTLHIIKKDLRRVGPAAVCWAVAGLTLLVLGGLGSTTGNYFADVARIVASASFAILSLSLVAEMVHEDGLEETTVFWRTRPIAGGRLLVSKLATLLLLLVVVPMVVSQVAQLFHEGAKSPSAGELGHRVLSIAAMVFSCAAVAACTKTLGRYLFAGGLCIAATVALAYWFDQWFVAEAPKIRMQQIAESRMLVVEAFCLACATGVLLSQYLWRNRTLSVALLGLAVIGTAGIVSLWRWPFL
ncbi:MAG: hypothetical protein HY302_04085 [Opitutae bacterium]|nr:hypothetical protein [Opitutae bacterium]